MRGQRLVRARLASCRIDVQHVDDALLGIEHQQGMVVRQPMVEQGAYVVDEGRELVTIGGG